MPDMEQDFSLLNQSTLALLNTEDVQELYKSTVFEAQKITRADSGSLFLYHSNTLHRIYSSVPKDKQGIPSPQGYSHKALQFGKPFVHTQNTLKLYHPEMYAKGVRAIIIIPLIFKDIRLGVLTLQSYRTTKIRSQKLYSLQLFGAIASSTLNKSYRLKDLEEALETRNLFIAVASHELKTPVTTISMYAQLVKKAVEKKMIPQKKWVEVLHTETSQLTQMIDDLLTKQKFSLYDLDYKWEPQSLFHLLKQTIEKYQTTYPDRKISFNTRLQSEDTFVVMDCNKIQQVIVNILNNAVKFSPQDKEICIKLHDKDEMICFQITDQGPGIPRENRRKIFERFYKGNHQKDGMGLGLYVAKTIIDKHNGNIKIRSAKFKGTTIQVALPKLLSE